MNICLVSSEVFPFAKSGGLADVCGAVPKYLAAAGHTVKVFMPWYRQIKDLYGDKVEVGKKGLYMSLQHEGFEVVFVKNNGFFWRDGLYSAYGKDYSDNLERFSFLCDQTLWLLEQMDFCPDIIHAHDWQSALIVILLKTAYRGNPFFAGTKTLLTIHNLAHQGRFGADKFRVLEKIGIHSYHFNMHLLEFYGDINLLKAAIILSDWTNTVSPTYSREVLSADFGENLQNILINKGGAFCGILNGIDNEEWNPLTDPNVEVKFDSKSFEKKKENKVLLQKRLGLEVNPNALLLNLVGRLTPQKGIAAVAECISSLPPNTQIAILGDGEEKYKILLAELESRCRNRFSLTVGHLEKLARSYFAGADGFFIPSLFEPCGLTQLYSYRYGVLPIVFPVGGLNDTVVDFSHGGCGFVCARGNLNSNGLLDKIKEAHSVFFNTPNEWEKRAVKAMNLDYGWKNSINKYISIYEYLRSGNFPG